MEAVITPDAPSRASIRGMNAVTATAFPVARMASITWLLHWTLADAGGADGSSDSLSSASLSRTSSVAGRAGAGTAVFEEADILTCVQRNW